MDPSDSAHPPMEETLNSTIVSMIATQGVKGVLLTDHEGLCVAARGTLEASTAARFTSILDNASKLGGEDDIPTVTIETAGSTTTVVSKDGFITAICK